MKNKLSNKNLVFFAFIWHGFFLALTMSMLDLNTVFPSLISKLSNSKLLFGSLYSIMLGVPLIFNLVFSHFLKKYKRKKKFLLLGIYLRSFAFLGMAFFTYKFSLSNPTLTIISFFFWIFLFSISAGFAGISYADIIGKLLKSEERTSLYASKQFFSSIAAFGGGLIVGKIFTLSKLVYPLNYSLNLFIGFIGLIIASLGFIMIKEPDSIIINNTDSSFLDYLKEVPKYLKEDFHFRKFIIVENMASFSIMLLPFYIIFAKEHFGISENYIGKYLIFQISGTILSNIAWGYLAKKFNAKTIVTVCIFLGGIIPIMAIILSLFDPNIYAILFFLIGFILSGRRIGFETYLLDIAPSEHRTEYLGIRGSLNIFVVIMPILGSIIIKLFGFYFTFIIVSIVMLSAGMILKKDSIK